MGGQFIVTALDFGTVNFTFANLLSSGSGLVNGFALLQRFTGTYGTGIASQSFSFSGQEVSRSFVPELNRTPMLGFGVLGLLGLAAMTRRGRSASQG